MAKHSKIDEPAGDSDDERFRELAARVGARVRELRKMQGLTLVAFEEFTGIDIAVLSKIEAGKVNLTLRTLDRLARGLGVHAHELLTPREQSGIRPKGRKGTEP